MNKSITTNEKEKKKNTAFLFLGFVLGTLLFAIAVNAAGGDSDASQASDFTLDGNLTTQEVILASSSITGSKHDFTFNSTLTPKGECSACHNIRIGEPFLWTRNLTEEEAYFNQTSNPNYVVAPTIYCYDCHDNHETVDNDPDYRFFINESLGRYIPQDVAFDGNMTGNTLTYDSSPSDNESGYYETIPPNAAPPIDGSSTAGHYITSNPSGLTNINQGDKLPCTDCHEPHNSEPTNEVFLRGSAYFPLGGKTVSNLKASTKTRSGTGTGRVICVNCHGNSDTGQSVRFVDINPDYGSTERIVQTPSGVSAHASTDNSSCSPCHSHDAPVHGDGATGAGCEECHGHDAGYGVTGGAGTYFSHSTHTEDDSDDLKGPNINCSDCHDTNSYPNFADNATTLAATAVCDSCHSPNGSFNGVQMAKSSWDSGVYSGGVLVSGKEKWCASCHDEEPAYSRQLLIDPVVIDNLDHSASFEGSWGTSSYAPGYYGSNYHYHEAGSGNDTFTWTPTIITTARIYQVFTRWTTSGEEPDTSRANDTTYTLYHDGGSTLVAKDQQYNGGQWVSLGTYSFDGENDYVELSQSANGIVVADAIVWCSPGGSPPPKPGIYAPNVIGDNATSGFYATGHGAHGWVECLSCHNARTEHIDHEHRTYVSASYNYQAGYRLAKPMAVPRPYRGTPINDNLYANLDDFALCGDCHNLYEVLGEDIEDYDASHTNFVRSDRTRNSHKYHINFGGLHFDSDWDWVSLDSAVTCIQCHNVHGPPNQAMMRHGELMSTYGTTDKVPGMKFSYLTSLSPKVYDTEADVKDSVGSSITWEDNHFAINGFCTASCHGSKLVSRTPYLGPKVLTKKAYPSSVPADGTAEVLITALVADHNDNVPSDGVAINLSSIGGGVETMYDDGINGGDLTSGDNIYSYTTTVPDTVASGFKSIQVTATDPDGEGECSITLHVQAVGEIILDNTEATYGGTWPSYTHSELYEGDGQYHEAGSGINTATWTPDILEAGYYNVYAWWHSNPTCRASDAPYTINYDGGSETIDINQSRYGGVWVLLGTYPFAPGTSGSVVLSDDANDYVIADAIKLEREDPGEIIRDDINAAYVGTWPSYKNPEPYGGEGQYHEAGTGANTATWTFTIRTTGNYNVYAWWHAHENRATNAPYTINYDSGSTTVEVCQEIRGGRWNYLGNYPFNVGDYSVVLSDDADEYLIADAIKFEQGSAPANPYPIADNWDATFVGGWSGSTWQGGGVINGPDFQYHEAGTGANTVTWTIAVPSAGNYNVYAWWSAHENRAANAPYTINYDGDSATVEVCQEIRGGRWNYLGNYPFNAGDYSVVLSDDADEYLIADAIKFEQGSAPANPYPIADNWDATFVGGWSGSTWQGGGATNGPDYQHKLGSDGNNNSVTWTTDIPTAGTYSVYTRWSGNDNRPTNAPYTVYYQGGSQEVTVDQTTDGGKWMYLGSYNFSADTYSVVLYDNVPTDKRLIADAVKWEKGLVVDNVNATFSGTWSTSSWTPGYFGTNYHYHGAGNGTDTATWTPNIPTAGSYSVYAWWSADTNRATNSSYTVNYDGGSETIEKNQTQDGGTWNLLGIYPFAKGTSGSVVLSDKADGFVIADAVRFERIKNNSWLTPTAIHCSNLSNASALIDNSTTTGNTLDSGTEQYVVFDLGTNYTVPSIKLYTDGNSYTWNVSMGNDTSNPSCCNYSDWGTQVIENWQTTSAGWTETELTTPTTTRYIKLTRSDGSGDLNADSLFEFMFDPPEAKLTYELHSFADLHIYDPAGRHAGMNYTTGAIENEIPGAVCSFGDVQTVSIPKLAVGEYKVILKGTGTGGYELTVTGESESGTISSETFSANITEGEIHDATTEVNTAEISNITITVDEPLEPTVQTVGVANVTLAGLFPAIDKVEVEKITLEAVDTTSMPETGLDVHSVFMINTTGSGNLVLRFDDIEHAEEVTAVYKVVQNGSWIPLPFTVNGSTIEVTLEAGDPPVVFVSSVQPEPTPTPTLTPTPTVTPTPTLPPAAGGGGPGGPLPAYLLPSPTPTKTIGEEDAASTKTKPNFNFMSSGVTSTPTTTPSLTPSATQPLEPEKEIPGFEVLSAVTGLLIIAYLCQRRRRQAV